MAAVLLPQEDVPADRHETGSGCDGRKGGETIAADAYGQAVWSCPLDAGVKFVDDFTSDGD